MAPSVMTDLTAEIESIKARCEANFIDFTNDDVSQLLTAYAELQRVACLMLAYESGDISEGRAAEMIGVDRIALREMKISALDAAIGIVARESKPRII